MKKEPIIFGFAVFGAVVIVYLLLKKGAPTQVSYPNANASGLPTYQSPSIAYNFGNSQAAPAPALIYGPPPALPQAPPYLTYNYPVQQMFGKTPEAAWLTPAPAPSAAGGGGCCCDDDNGPKFTDGALFVGVAADKSEQVKGGSKSLFDSLNNNIYSSGLATPDMLVHVVNNAIGSLPNQSF